MWTADSGHCLIHQGTNVIFSVSRDTSKDRNNALLELEAATGGVLQKWCSKYFAKFTAKIPVLESHFNNVTTLQPEVILKKKLQHRYFPVNFAKFLRTHFLQNTSGWLLLQNYQKIMLAFNHCGTRRQVLLYVKSLCENFRNGRIKNITFIRIHGIKLTFD